MSIRKKEGFTALEILVALGIFLLIIVSVMEFGQRIFSSNRIIFTQVSNQKEARRIIEDLVKEIRSASVSSVGSYLIAEATPTSFVFYSDIDSDTYREKVRYFLDGVNFKKGVIKPSGTPLTYNPANETIMVAAHDLVAGQTPFSYFDQHYDGTSPPLSFPVNVMDIRLVKATLVIDQKPQISPEPLTVSSQVEIRNLKYSE